MNRKLTLVLGLGIGLMLAACKTSSTSQVADTQNPQMRPAQMRVISNVVARSVSGIVDRQSSSDPIPAEILAAARCIASVSLWQGGFIFGGGGGGGMVSCRMANGQWSAPSFLTISKFGVGLTIGVSGTDMVLVFMADSSRKLLDHLEMSLDLGSEVTLGPVGQHVAIGANPESQILMYGKSVGLAIDLLSLRGTLLTHMPARNAIVYGNLGLSAGHDVLAIDGQQTPQIAGDYVRVLNRYVH